MSIGLDSAIVLANMSVTDFRKFRSAYLVLLRAGISPDSATVILCDAYSARVVRRYAA